MNTLSSLYTKVLIFAILLALTVIVLGAYTRLSDAGLGCPDWPGCYGHLGVPDKVTDSTYERPLEHGKAWKEMIHRYIAGTLGLVILFILFLVLKNKPVHQQGKTLPVLLVATVVFQALLGMWTVTLLLSPLIVTAHLIGGFTTLAILWWLLLNQTRTPATHRPPAGIRLFALGGLILVILQILLGGWTSTNYAALACGNQFPTCAGQWWPAMDFAEGFNLQHSPGVNYEFGVLESPARSAIQMAHRIGAVVVFGYLLVLGIKLLKCCAGHYAATAMALLLLLLAQISLGILNVVLGLPIIIAVTHTLVAALLLLAIVKVNHALFKGNGY